jgi:hypothetical protein
VARRGRICGREDGDRLRGLGAPEWETPTDLPHFLAPVSVCYFVSVCYGMVAAAIPRHMSGITPKKVPENRPQEIIKRFRNKPSIAWIIAIATMALGAIVFTNSLVEQSTKLWYHIFPPPVEQPPAFAVTLAVLLDYPVPAWWIVRPQDRVCPATLALYIFLTDLQSHAAAIDEMSVEAVNADDQWVRIPRIKLLPGAELYASFDPTQTSLTENVNSLDRIFEHGNLQPHVPIEGWMFFEKPFLESFNRIRVHLRDLEGTEFTSGALAASSKGERGARIDFHQPRVILDMTKQRVDYHCGS